MKFQALITTIVCTWLVWPAGVARVQAGTPFSLPVEHYRLEQHGGGLGIQIDETVLILASGDTGQDPQWIVERQRRELSWCGQKSAEGTCLKSDVTIHDWASSMNCPFLSIYVKGFSDFRETGGDSPSVLVSDKPLTTLIFTDSAVDKKESKILREYVGPLVTWWQDVEAGLKGCWTTEPPTIDGRRLDKRLAAPNP